MNILIVKLSAIGDVVHTLPALNAIRKHYPDAHIAWLVEDAAYGILEGHKALDRIIVSKRKKWVKGLRTASRLNSIREAYRFIMELRDTHYDLVIDFQALLKSAVLIALAKGKQKIGFDKGMEHMEHSYLFLKKRVPPVDMENHALLRGLMLLEALGIASDEIIFHFPVFDQDRHRMNDLLDGHGVNPLYRIVAINPVAKWETKLWGSKKFACLADKLRQRYDAELVFTGGEEDQETIQDILSGMKGDAVNLAGETTLKMLAALYEKAKFVVSTDTGPAHVAAAVGTPIVALFGPTAPWRTGPFGEGHEIIRADLECSPCFKRRCETKACMEQISVQDVLDGIEKLNL